MHIQIYITALFFITVVALLSAKFCFAENLAISCNFVCSPSRVVALLYFLVWLKWVWTNITTCHTICLCGGTITKVSMKWWSDWSNKFKGYKGDDDTAEDKGKWELYTSLHFFLALITGAIYHNHFALYSLLQACLVHTTLSSLLIVITKTFSSSATSLLLLYMLATKPQHQCQLPHLIILSSFFPRHLWKECRLLETQRKPLPTHCLTK